jgi:hypothetical protein
MNTANKYACEPCKYKGFNKKDYERHIGTAKHKRLVQAIATEATITTETETITASISQQPSKHKCACGKEYVYKSILEKHQKKCDKTKPETITPPTNLTNSSVSEDEVARLMKMLQDRTAEFERKIAEEKANDEKAREERRARALATGQALAAAQALAEAQALAASRPQQEVINLNNVNNNREININMYLNREYNDPESISKFLKLVRPVIAYIYAGNDCSDELPLTINTFLGRIEISEKKKDDPDAPPPFPVPNHIPMCSATLQHGVSCSLSEEIPDEEEEKDGDGCGECEFCRSCANRALEK